MGPLERLQEIKRKAELKPIDMAKVMPYVEYWNDGAWNDLIGTHSLYYKYMARVVENEKPKQIVELGSAAGCSALMMLSHAPKDTMIYACTIPEPEGEFRFIKEDYPNLKLIRGDDLDLEVWKGVDLSKTDLWFWDTDHNYNQIHSEYVLYKPFLKPGTLVFIDDIHLNEGMSKFWDEVEFPKLELLNWHSYKDTGFGVFTV